MYTGYTSGGWAPDETAEVYELRTAQGPELVAGHRCGDFAVRHIFEGIEVEDEERPGERFVIPAGRWALDHLPSRTMIFHHARRDLVSFVADGFAAHFEGLCHAEFMAAVGPVQDWVLVSVRAYTAGMTPCSLNAWLRSRTWGPGELLRYMPATLPQNLRECEAVLAGD